MEQTVPEGVLGLDEVKSGPEPGSQPSEARTGPATVFLDRLDDPIINLDRVEDLEETNSDGSDSTIEVVPLNPTKRPNLASGDQDEGLRHL